MPPKHSFTYTPDGAKATAILGNTDSAYGQVWHPPTSAQRWTGEEFITWAAAMKGAKASYTLLTPFLLSSSVIFNDESVAEWINYIAGIRVVAHCCR